MQRRSTSLPRKDFDEPARSGEVIKVEERPGRVPVGTFPSLVRLQARRVARSLAAVEGPLRAWVCQRRSRASSSGCRWPPLPWDPYMTRSALRPGLEEANRDVHAHR